MRKILIFVSIICLLALVGCVATPTAATLPPLPKDTAVLATLTITIIPTATITPDIAKPTLSPNLLPVNNMSAVWENNSWVIKNADGKITAKWDAIENKWKYNFENLAVILSGVMEPNSEIKGLGSFVYENKKITIPTAWESVLPKDQIDPNPLVPLGYIDTLKIQTQDTAGNIWSNQEFGVDYRGIILAQTYNGDHVYVAGFTTTNPMFPDRQYLITLPISDMGGYTGDDLYATGIFDPKGGTNEDYSSSDGLPYSFHVDELLKVLQDPDTVGRRMVLSFPVSDTGKWTDDPSNENVFYSQSHIIFADALANGTSFDTSQMRLTESNIRLPHDLHSIESKK